MCLCVDLCTCGRRYPQSLEEGVVFLGAVGKVYMVKFTLPTAIGKVYNCR